MATIASRTWHTRVYVWGLRESSSARGVEGAAAAACVDDLPHLLHEMISGNRIMKVACGSFFALLLCDNGVVLAFGCTSNGRTGVASSAACMRIPSPVARITSVTHVAASEFCSLFVTCDGTLWRSGKLLGSENALPEPHALPTGMLARSAALGDRTAVVLTSTGCVLCVGNNSHAQCGVRPADAHEVQREWRVIPLPVPAVSIAARCRTVYAVLADGSVMAWGSNECGSLGVGAAPTTVPYTVEPVRVVMPEGVRAAHVAASVGPMNMHTALVTTTGQLFSWGSDYKFKTGVNAAALTAKDPGAAAARPHHGNSTHSAQIFTQPHVVPSVCFSEGARIAGVAAAALHSVAWTEDGQLYEWGCGSDGRLGFPDYRAKRARYLYHEPAPRLQTAILGRVVCADAYKYQTVVVTELSLIHI